ncbi:MAG: hypothetical protein Q4C05_05460, partial [Akkermansia sp.]|nr:hypothetical protein [Akkermansia sp.]
LGPTLKESPSAKLSDLGSEGRVREVVREVKEENVSKVVDEKVEPVDAIPHDKGPTLKESPSAQLSDLGSGGRVREVVREVKEENVSKVVDEKVEPVDAIPHDKGPTLKESPSAQLSDLGSGGRVREVVREVKEENVSKVLDENGEPVVVYHGTGREGIREFSHRKAQDKLGRAMGHGQGRGKFYLSTSRQGAENAGRGAVYRGEGKQSRLYKV